MLLEVPSFSYFTESGNPKCSSCWCQTVQAELIEINAKNDWNRFDPLRQHRLLRLNAFMFAAMLHQSVKQP